MNTAMAIRNTWCRHDWWKEPVVFDKVKEADMSFDTHKKFH